MDEDVILNSGDPVVIPPVADTTIPLTPDVPVDIETPIDEPIIDAPIPEGNPDLTKISEFFGTIQESVTIAWRYHLKTNKHRVHVTLNEYYDEALEKVDAIIEQYQGASGNIIDNYINTILPEGKTEIEYFQELKSFVETHKTSDGFDGELVSTIEDYQGLIDSTLYKLTSFTEHAIKSYDEFLYEDYTVIGVEGGVDGVFDNVTKTTKTNVAPNGATCKCQKCNDNDCNCDDEEEEE